MKDISKPNEKNEDILFMLEDDYANETAIYFEIASEEFITENNFLLEKTKSGDPLRLFFWEENDEFGIFD